MCERNGAFQTRETSVHGCRVRNCIHTCASRHFAAAVAQLRTAAPGAASSGRRPPRCSPLRQLGREAPAVLLAAVCAGVKPDRAQVNWVITAAAESGKSKTSTDGHSNPQGWGRTKSAGCWELRTHVAQYMQRGHSTPSGQLTLAHSKGSWSSERHTALPPLETAAGCERPGSVHTQLHPPPTALRQLLPPEAAPAPARHRRQLPTHPAAAACCSLCLSCPRQPRPPSLQQPTARQGAQPSFAWQGGRHRCRRTECHWRWGAPGTAGAPVSGESALCEACTDARKGQRCTRLSEAQLPHTVVPLPQES